MENPGNSWHCLEQVSKEGIGVFDFSAETMNKLTAPLAANMGAPVAADLAVPLSGPIPAMPYSAPSANGNSIQVLAAVAKEASEQELRQIFGSVPGLEYCRMLPHQDTGLFEVRIA